MASPEHKPTSTKLPAASEDNDDSMADVSVGGEITQMTDAPEEFTLSPLEPFTGPHDFPTWLENVTRILRRLNLYHFIDRSAPHPPGISPLTDRWCETSKKISLWMHQSAPDNINRLVQHIGFHCDFADQYLEALKFLLKR